MSILGGNFCFRPKESKPRTSVIGVRGIEYKPTVADPEQCGLNVVQYQQDNRYSENRATRSSGLRLVVRRFFGKPVKQSLLTRIP
jgi:hypothetical protein